MQYKPYSPKTFLAILLNLAMLASLMAAAGACGESSAKLTIMHTNDARSHLDNIARLATAIAEARDEAGPDNTLLLDAGDVCGGALYYNLYKGQADTWFMQKLGYDAMCPGNHEFDDGAGTFSDFIESVSFPVLCANFDFSGEEDMAQEPAAWTIIEKDGKKYGIFGLTTPETAEISSPGTGIVINDPIAAAKQAVTELQAQGINKIIAVTHLGWDEDLALAAEVSGIDIIVGGHSATVPETYPAVISTHNAPTLVVQAGEFRDYLGRLDVVFDSSGILQSWQGELIAIDETIKEDTAIAAKLVEYQEPVAELMNNIIGHTNVFLDGEKANLRSMETNLGNMIADAILDKTKSAGAAIAILNGGSIRASIPAGDISLGQVIEALPYENYLVVIDLSGEQIITALENGVSQVEDVAGRFPQVAGLRFTWNPDNPAGNRITSVEVKNGNSYSPIEAAATYRVAINNFLYQGGDGYSVFQNGTSYTNAGFIYYEILAEYIKNYSPLAPQIEGRITNQSG